MKTAYEDLWKEIQTEEKLRQILLRFYEIQSKDILIGFFFDGKNLIEIANKQAAFLIKTWGISTTTHQPHFNPPHLAHQKIAPILEGHFYRRLIILKETLKEFNLSEQSIDDWIKFESAFEKAVVK